MSLDTQPPSTAIALDDGIVGSFVQVDVQENGYGDGFGWKFLTDATLTASRIRGHAREEVTNALDSISLYLVILLLHNVSG